MSVLAHHEDIAPLRVTPRQAVKNYAVLDMGSQQITCVIAEHKPDSDNGENVHVIGVGHAHTLPSMDDKNRDRHALKKSISLAINHAERDAKIKVAELHVTCSLAYPQSAFFTFTHICPEGICRRDDAPHLMKKAYDAFMVKRHTEERNRDEAHLYCMVSSVQLDGKRHDFTQGDTAGHQLELKLCMLSISRTVYEQIANALNALGVRFAQFSLPSYTDSFALAQNMVLEKHYIALHLGAHYISAGAFSYGQLQAMRLLEMGCDYITHDIMQAFAISRHEAESLKRERGCVLLTESEISAESSISKKLHHLGRHSSNEQKYREMVALLPAIIKPRIEEIFDYCQTLIAPMEEDLPIILTGGGAQLPGLLPFVRKRLQRRVLLQTPPSVSGLTFASPRYSYNTALGLLHMAVQNPQNVIKMPKNELKTNSWLDKLSFFSKESL